VHSEQVNMKPANPRTGGARILNGKLAFLGLVVVLSIETCIGLGTPEQDAADDCKHCINDAACLKMRIDAICGKIDLACVSYCRLTEEELEYERKIMNFLKDCCNTATGELDKCAAEEKKKIAARTAGSDGDLLAPKACLVLLSLGTLMMAWLY